MHSWETVGIGICITRMGTGRNCNAYTTIQFKSHISNCCRAFLIALLVLPQLKYIIPQLKYILSNLHSRYTLGVPDILEHYLC